MRSRIALCRARTLGPTLHTSVEAVLVKDVVAHLESCCVDVEASGGLRVCGSVISQSDCGFDCLVSEVVFGLPWEVEPRCCS